MTMIQVLQASPTKSPMLKLFKLSKKPVCTQQALLIGTQQSGKKSILSHIDRLEVPLDIFCLSNDVPVATYHNFLFDVPYVIFVFDSTKLSLSYLERVSEILTHMLAPGSCCKKLLILLNKQDLLCIDQARVIEKRLHLSKLDVEYLIMPTNGKNGYGISEGVNWLFT